MGQSHSSEASNYSASREIPRFYWTTKVHCRVHKSPPLVPILSLMHLVHMLRIISLRSILISSHLRLGLPSGSSLHVFRPKFCIFVYKWFNCNKFFF